MARMTAAQFAEKWARNAQGNVQSYKDGVNAVQEAPGIKAAANADRYVRGVQKSVEDGIWQERVSSVPLAEWKQLTIDKGANRYSDGVSKAKPKMQRFGEQLLQHTEQVKAAIAQMPKGTESDSEARMLAAVRMMRQLRFRRR